jgi:transcriptional regulator with XRE-family HTH domain
MSDARSASPMDFILGKKLRDARLEASLSQQMLAARLGITFQQIQKYEKGTNRIAASRLVSIARAVDKPISYFLDDAKEAAGAARANGKASETGSSVDQASLIGFFSSIENRRVRRQVIDLMRTIAAAEDARRGGKETPKRKVASATRKPVKKTRVARKR